MCALCRYSMCLETVDYFSFSPSCLKKVSHTLFSTDDSYRSILPPIYAHINLICFVKLIKSNQYAFFNYFMITHSNFKTFIKLYVLSSNSFVKSSPKSSSDEITSYQATHLASQMSDEIFSFVKTGGNVSLVCKYLQWLQHAMHVFERHTHDKANKATNTHKLVNLWGRNCTLGFTVQQHDYK